MTPQATPVRIHYAAHLGPDDTALLSFRDARGRHAVWGDLADDDMAEGTLATPDDVMDVLLSSPNPASDLHNAWFGAGAAAVPVTLTVRGAAVSWRPGRALLACDVDDREALLAAVVDFDFHAREIVQVQREVAAAWTTLDADRHLVFRVTPADLKQDAAIGARIEETFARRIRLARVASGAWHPTAGVPAAGRRLGEDLRERAALGDRADAVSDELEVFEHVYEMASQRMGEFRASYGEARLEWVIIGLLTLETMILLIGMIYQA